MPGPLDSVYNSIKQLATSDLPTLRHLMTARDEYTTTGAIGAKSKQALQTVLEKLSSVDPVAAAAFGLRVWDPNATEWSRFFDAVGPDGFGAYLGISSKDQIPTAPAGQDAPIDDEGAAGATAPGEEPAPAEPAPELDDENPLKPKPIVKGESKSKYAFKKDTIMDAKQIRELVKQTDSPVALLAKLCEDMSFSKGASVFVASGLGKTYIRGKFQELDGVYAKVKDQNGVVHTCLPHMVFAN